ncbi:hypothetical protein [Limnospira platensis]|uniref:hypothetical protein n=1 Tax=Limnospira platensis TaxID=118562 RepID=UPI00139F2BF5|nr:hypothetical protein AP9108_36825 [Arthrospira sp. PCC 9108]WAK74567.1 hypothetical protein AP9108_34445 [Arthrospira sp. PCC 9108]
MNAAYQPISLLHIYDGSSRTFGFPNHGWLAVVGLLGIGFPHAFRSPLQSWGCDSQNWGWLLWSKGKSPSPTPLQNRT